MRRKPKSKAASFQLAEGGAVPTSAHHKGPIMPHTKPTTKQVPNPTGKGGFGEHPENRSDGGWKKENTISYQYKRFLNMTPAELKQFASKPEEERTVAMDIAYSRVLASRKSLMDVKEITDRTEGKAPQFIGLGGSDEYKQALVEFIGEDKSD